MDEGNIEAIQQIEQTLTKPETSKDHHLKAELEEYNSDDNEDEKKTIDEKADDDDSVKVEIDISPDDIFYNVQMACEEAYQQNIKPKSKTRVKITPKRPKQPKLPKVPKAPKAPKQVKRKHKSAPQPQFNCHICDQTFYKRVYLKRHLSTHTFKEYLCVYSVEQLPSSTTDKFFQCKICQETHPEHKLKEHMSFHIEEKQLSCELCNMKFSMANSLTQHMATHKTRPKKPPQIIMQRHDCRLCDKKFARTNDLRDHMRTHTGEKPYSCEICHTQFSLNTNYNKHMRIHAEVKKFSCHLCELHFHRKDYLQRHMYKHTQLKPFSCESCGHSCNDKANLKKHTLNCKGFLK